MRKPFKAGNNRASGIVDYQELQYNANLPVMYADRSEGQMSPGYRDQSDPVFGRESIFRKKLNELRTTGHIAKLPTAEGNARSREIERNALLESVSQTMQKTDKREMERLTLLDTVTELYNHDTISRILKDEVKRAKRYRVPMSILMIRIDGFREANAKFGQLTGDSILRGVSNFVINIVRDVDIPARYDAETYLVICPNTDAQGIAVLAERLRTKIITERVSDVGQNWTVSLSIGMGSYPVNGVKDDELLRSVMTALTEAEIQGGNRYAVAAATD
jgi:diguanylate cyclase (GGDEF)-like protein